MPRSEVLLLLQLGRRASAPLVSAADNEAASPELKSARILPDQSASFGVD